MPPIETNSRRKREFLIRLVVQKEKNEKKIIKQDDAKNGKNTESNFNMKNNYSSILLK